MVLTQKFPKFIPLYTFNNMKKLILLTSFSGLLFFVNAQKSQIQYTNNDLLNFPHESHQPSSTKALGQVLWSDDFDDTSTWVIDNDGQTGLEFGWNINSTNEGWWSGNGINSTSGGANAELVNGNPTLNPGTQAQNVTYTLTTDSMIDIAALGGSNMCILQFEQYGARFNDLQEVQISYDGTTFTTIGDNLDQPVLSSAGGSPYPNPMTKTINLATILGATPQPFYLRFSWTTNFPSQATNANVWITYGWYLDDVKIIGASDNDLSVVSETWGTNGLQYYQIPTTQIAPIDFAATVFNGGSNDQTNVSLNVDINSGAYTGSNVPVTINSLDTATLSMASPFTPSTVGNYAATLTLTADSTDDDPSNNTLNNISFEVTNYIYARDNGQVQGSTNRPNGFQVGNLFEIFQDQLLKGIDVRLDGSTVTGTEVYARIYSLDNGNFAFLAESDPLILTSGDISTNLTMELNTPVTLTAGEAYLAVIGTFSSDMSVANAGTTDPQTSFLFREDDQTWYYTTNVPYVRLNFDPTISIEENNSVSLGAIYPNPANSEVNIEFSINNSPQAQIIVTDLYGKEVYSKAYQYNSIGTQKETIDFSSLKSGSYFITIESGKSSSVKRLIKL